MTLLLDIILLAILLVAIAIAIILDIKEAYPMLGITACIISCTIAIIWGFKKDGQ